MYPTTFIYSSHNCSPYIHRQIIAQRALEEHEDKRLLYLPMSEGMRGDDEFERQEFGWGKFRWYFDQFRKWGLEPQPFYWSEGLRRQDLEVLWEVLQNAPVVIPSLPQFLVTRGTAYFLLPSVGTLRQIAGVTS